ncbi:hypothetical protein Tco_1367885 [Tanacetum coccineum]
MGGIFSIEARDMDTKLLSTPESNNTLARCWFRRNIPVTTFGSWHDKVHFLHKGRFLVYPLFSVRVTAKDLKVSFLLFYLWLVIIVAVVGVGVTIVVVVESSFSLRFRGGNIPFNTSRQSPDENFYHFLRIWHHSGTQGWAKEFHQDRASLVKVLVANFTLQSSVQLLRVSLNFIESIKEVRSRVQDLTSGEIVSLNLLSRTRKLGHSTMELRSLIKSEQLHKENEHLKQTYKDLFDSIKRTRVQTKNQNDSLIEQLNKKSNENADVLAQIQKKGFAIAALKNELRKLTGNSVNTKFAKPSILGKPVGQPLKNQSVVRQPTAFKSERPRISKPRFASQVDVNNDLSKPVTTHHLPKRRESAPAKPHHMIAPSSSRYSSNDIVHNHYLEEAKKKTHEHSRIPRNFSDSKHFVCSTCQKCVFNANHDACVIKFLKEVNSRAKVPSNKTTNRNKPVEQIRVATKPKRQIPKGHRFSIKKTTTVHEKTTSPRSCLRWQPTGRILKTVCLRWVPTGKTFASSTTKVESEPPNGSNADIPNQCESEQALNVSAGTLLSTGTSFNPTEEGLRVWLRKRKISQKTGLQGILI